MSDTKTAYSAWNPGLSSQIPSSLQSEITLFRSENSSVDYRTAKELSDFSGLKPVELVSFKIERLIIHDLLVRVTSDLSVPDGPNYEDLGISLRSMVHTIFSDYVLPDIEEYRQAFEEARGRCTSFIEGELSEKFYSAATQPVVRKKDTLLSRLFSAQKAAGADSKDKASKELAALDDWQQCSESEPDSLKKHCLVAVHRVVDAIVAHRGRLVNQPELVTTIAVNMALNGLGSELAQTMMEPVFKRAVEAEKFRWLPTQTHPVVMNVKGASASGKSTIRPRQRELAGKLGIPWEDFALISPDYWRKYLLDYSSLGDDSKYAAMLTGQELE
ncbi:MAG: hypothetical protein AAF404_21955, partial [Pseudomonadota bacterium]